MWAVTNTQKTTQKAAPNQPGTSNDASKDDNSAPTIGAPSIVVPDDYPNITSAVEHAQSGDVILSSREPTSKALQLTSP